MRSGWSGLVWSCSPEKPPGDDQEEEGEDEGEDGVGVVIAGP